MCSNMTDEHGTAPAETKVARLLADEIEALRRMPVAELRVAWKCAFGRETRNRNKDYLWRRIAYRIQERAEGGLSPQALARIEEILRDGEYRPRRPLPTLADLSANARDPRLPPPGRVLARTFRGELHEVTVLINGFEYRGQRHASLSSIARRIAGTRWNGFVFFGIGTEAAA